MNAVANEPRIVMAEGNRSPAFLHPCSVCGSSLAPFGLGVRLNQGKPGTWYCASHYPDRAKTRQQRDLF